MKESNNLLKAARYIRSYCKRTSCKKCAFTRITHGNVIFCSFDFKTPSLWNIKRKRVRNRR